MEEFEIKFLEVDVPELEKKLLSFGAEKVGEYDYHRAIFDYPDWRMDEKHSWLRLRTDGKPARAGGETTLTYKERIGAKSKDASIRDEGMKEIEVIVSDYEKTYELLKAIGLVTKREEENRRIRYKKGGVVFDIDFHPQIPPYLEVEASSLKEAQEAASELGFDLEKSLICSSKQIYKKYGINVDDYSLLTHEGLVKK